MLAGSALDQLVPITTPSMAFVSLREPKVIQIDVVSFIEPGIVSGSQLVEKGRRRKLRVLLQERGLSGFE